MTIDRLGRVVVRFAIRYLRWRYRRQIRIGIGASLAGLALAAYVASRNVPEG